mgnify:CR=1 FL=1
MKKTYLATYEKTLNMSQLHSCLGYLQALKDERILKGEILKEFSIFYKDHYSSFSKVFSEDKELWDKLQKKSLKSVSIPLYFIRAEVEDIGKLNPKMQSLRKNYPFLEFVVYDSDIK